MGTGWAASVWPQTHTTEHVSEGKAISAVASGAVPRATAIHAHQTQKQEGQQEPLGSHVSDTWLQMGT